MNNSIFVNINDKPFVSFYGIVAAVTRGITHTGMLVHLSTCNKRLVVWPDEEHPFIGISDATIYLIELKHIYGQEYSTLIDEVIRWINQEGIEKLSLNESNYPVYYRELKRIKQLRSYIRTIDNRDDDDESRVYFIFDSETKRIKIGKSLRPDERIKQLQTGSPGRLTMLFTQIGDERHERELHRQFAEHRIQGEWFRDCVQIREYIGVCQSASLDGQSSSNP